ncbi:MAG: helix-turn-helix transcriptional regulator [Crenarchaeota archaeon]|nr:helix-turn-helix transcriptional regulator [Thermoproteota archaeon]
MSLSSIYLAISSERRLRILSCLRSLRCANIEELSSKLRIGIPSLLYELKILQHGGLVSLEDGTVCITDRGVNVISKIASLDQDLLAKSQSEETKIHEILSALSFRTLAIYIAVSGGIGTLPLALLVFLGLLLFYKFHINLVVLVPSGFHNFNPYTLVFSPLILLTYFLIILKVFSRKVMIIEALQCCLLTLCIVSIYAVIYYLTISILGISTISLIILESSKLILPTLSIISSSTLISYHSGKPFESTFLLTSLTLLIPCLLAYALMR